MNVINIFSDAPYRNKHFLKILNHLVVICVFYRPECDKFLTAFQRVYLVICSYVLDQTA